MTTETRNHRIQALATIAVALVIAAQAFRLISLPTVIALNLSIVAAAIVAALLLEARARRKEAA